MILDRQSRINTNDLKTRLDAVGMDRGSFSPEELTEFVNLMQVYEGAMYEISTKPVSYTHLTLPTIYSV